MGRRKNNNVIMEDGSARLPGTLKKKKSPWKIVLYISLGIVGLYLVAAMLMLISAGLIAGMAIARLGMICLVALAIVVVVAVPFIFLSDVIDRVKNKDDDDDDEGKLMQMQ